jgi:NAD(P)-dependent dehydrogenase (short-subunit alcohol dehydrogenase family)
MDLDLKDKVAVVVGAASGIGRAVATQFAAEGCRVCWLDKAEDVETTAQELCQTAAHDAWAFQVDATDFPSMKEIAGSIYGRYGRCDHVVVSIGVGSGKFGFPFWNLDPLDWEQVLRVNLIGAVNIAYAFVPPMLPARQGTMCFLSSVAGQIGSQTDPPYSAAKAGLINFAQCAAKDLAPYNIRVNVVSPGMVKTPLNQNVWKSWRDASTANTLSYDEWAAAKIRSVAPLGRWQQPADVAAMIVFLASDRAANVTGQTVNVDGGQVMHS